MSTEDAKAIGSLVMSCMISVGGSFLVYGNTANIWLAIGTFPIAWPLVFILLLNFIS